MTRALVTAIVSGGQTGADRGGLQAAIALGLGWGGWAPQGWRAEDGEVPAVYREHMRESASPHYGLRTRLNVQDSDGTLIVSFAENLSGGSAFTARTAKAQRKPARHLILPARGRTRITDAVRAALLQWIGDNRISVLNIAGPRESKEPGIQQATHEALVWVLEDDAAVDVLPGMPDAAAVIGAVCEHGISKAGDVLMARYPEAARRFADVDRTAAPESLQHVAEPRPIDWEHMAERAAAAQPYRCIPIPAPLYAELERRLSERPPTAPLTPYGERICTGTYTGVHEPGCAAGLGSATRALRIGDPVDAPGWQTTIDANMAEVDKHQVHGAQVPDDFGPATRADLDDLDAVPEPVDSDQPSEVHRPGSGSVVDGKELRRLDNRSLDAAMEAVPGCAPIGPDAETRPIRRVRHITGPDGVPRPESEDPERLAARVKARPQDVVDWIVDRSKALIERSKHAAHCPAKCSPAKPTLPEVRPLIDAYYALPGNGAGGELHVVLDDGNYERSNIEYCIAKARREETKALGAVLMLLSNSQRRRM